MFKISTCRLCLCKIEGLLDHEYTNVIDENLLDQIKILFGFEVSAGSILKQFDSKKKFLLQLNSDANLPQIVCSYCTNHVNSYYEYHRKVLENQEKLQGLVYEEECFEEEPKIEVFTEEIVIKSSKQANKPNWDVDRISKFITFRCDTCFEPSMDFLEWKSHMTLLHDDETPSYVCCGTKLTTERSFLTHINKCHDPAKKGLLSCAICLKEFQRKAQIEAHMRVHIRKVPNGYQCKKCPETFLMVRHWRAHQLLHEPNSSMKDILFPCKKCSNEYLTMKLLQAHLRNDHKKKFLCELCAKVFNIKFSLTEHVRKTHSTENPRKEKCPHCATTFLTKSHLKSHINLLHTGKGVYPCDKCDKVAVTEKQLKNHVQYTHQMDRNFKCKYCHKGKKVAISSFDLLLR